MVFHARCAALLVLTVTLPFFSYAPVLAQDGAGSRAFSGVVVDARTGAALPGVNVVVDAERGLGGATDEDGRFAISGLPPESFLVRFSFVGYESDSLRIDLTQGSFQTRVSLQPVSEVIAEVVVEGETELLERGAQAVAVLEAAELDAARGQSLGETLEALPGVTTLSTGPTITKPVVRGLHSERVVVLNNGVRQEGQQWGAEHAPEIDPFAHDRVELVRGAAGVEHGVGAIGGVVRLEEAPLPSVPGAFGGDLSLQGFSNSQQGAGSLMLEGAPTVVPGFGFRVQGSARRAGDARTPDYVLGNTAFFERSANATVGLTRDRWGVEVHGSHFATDLGIYRGSHFNTFEGIDTVLELGRPPVDYTFDYEIDAPKQEISHTLASVSGFFRPDGVLEGALIEARYGYQLNKRKEFDASRLGGRDPLARAAFALDLATHTLNLKLTTAPRTLFGGDGFAVVGVDGMNQGNVGQVGYLIPNFRALTGGAFARTTWQRGPLTLDAGLRLDHRWQQAFPRERGQGSFERDKRTYTGVSTALGATWRLSPTWSIATNFATAWRPPSINELYSYGIHHGTAQFERGERSLGEERSLGADLTLRHQSARFEAEVSGYAQRIADFLYLRPLDEPVVTSRGIFPDFAYTQDDARLVGIDGYAQARLGRVTLAMSGSLLRGTNTDLDEALLAMPADRLGFDVGFTAPDLGPFEIPTLELGATLVGEQDRFPTRLAEDGTVVPVDYVAPPDGYTLLRAGFSTEVHYGTSDVHHARLSLTVENLLDTAYRDYLSRYRFFAQDPGRNVVLRLTVPFGTP